MSAFLRGLRRLREVLMRVPRGALRLGLTTFELVHPRGQLRQALRRGVQVCS